MSELQPSSTTFTTVAMPGSGDLARASYSTPLLIPNHDFAARPAVTATKETVGFVSTERSRTLQELQHHPIYGRLWQAPSDSAQAEPSPLERAREQRLEILARQYEGAQLTREDKARVAILTQRLRRLAPRITSKSWTIAEEAMKQLELSSARVDEITAKYGL